MDDTEAYAASDTDGWEWMFLEVMGHRSHWGRARQEERYGTKMLRIDVPTFPSPPSLFDHADGKPVAPPVVWETHFYGGGSIFSITLTDEETVMALAEYVENYRFEFDDGRQYTPREEEKAMLEDAIEGWLAQDGDWQPIKTKPNFVTCEERGIYTDNGDGLFYFKATHWRPVLTAS